MRIPLASRWISKDDGGLKLSEYLSKRTLVPSPLREARPFCQKCHRPGGSCLCIHARTFRTEALFVILIHPREARRTIGTARIIGLCLDDSLLIECTGAQADQNEKIRKILADPGLDPWLLFPGHESIPVEKIPRNPAKRPVIFVVDGTWPQARKMIRSSSVLKTIPRVAFVPEHLSRYSFRKEPAAHCVSTVEAVHSVISKIDGPRPGPSPQDVLLEVLAELVRTQTLHEKKSS